jgi:hypothetical protein
VELVITICVWRGKHNLLSSGAGAGPGIKRTIDHDDRRGAGNAFLLIPTGWPARLPSVPVMSLPAGYSVIVTVSDLLLSFEDEGLKHAR